MDEEHSEWPVESDDLDYLGTSERGKPVFFDRDTGHVYRGRIDHDGERLVPDEEPSWQPDPEETLGEVLERIGNEVGWQSLSEFAREHLEDDES